METFGLDQSAFLDQGAFGLDQGAIFWISVHLVWSRVPFFGSGCIWFGSGCPFFGSGCVLVWIRVPVFWIRVRFGLDQGSRFLDQDALVWIKVHLVLIKCETFVKIKGWIPKM